MFIGGFQKFTMLDYPEKVAATVFTMGCNFRCPYCHNAEIVNPKLIDYEIGFQEKEIIDFLEDRKGSLDGICITGGEPTLQSGLMEFIRKIKEMGFLIKLDTNASHSNVVKNLLNEDLIDYWAIDIKTAPEKYRIMTKKEDAIRNIEQSIDMITQSRGDLELRTTIAPGYVTFDDFDKIIDWINSINSEIFSKLYRYSIQNFKPEKTLHKKFGSVVPYDENYLKKITEKMKKVCDNVVTVG
ncbi:MAG: anaerobic ribonucleoside-triphosphate reductase activating protein [Candidatus Pacebacteria bacterium]|nr:anaerobic ribonucleoside-triphosphate reductase activating protein [Candidatus Paceibacterota bacterium]